MAEPRIVILDTNILFSALLSSTSSFSKTILQTEHKFYVNELVLVEIFKHKTRITELSQLSEDEVVQLFYRLLRRLEMYKEDLITSSNRLSAYQLCQDVDKEDTPHVALTLELNGILWTGDKKLKEGLIRKGFDRFYEPPE